MKKTPIIVLFIGWLVHLAGAQSAPQPKPEDMLKNLVQFDAPQPVPESMRAGFESITARDSLAMLNYIAHDLMEGRETGTRGYRLAVEFAAAMMSMWKVQPAADSQPPQGRGGFSGSGQESPVRPAGKSFLQEFPLREITSSSSSLSVEIRRGDSVKVRPFSPNIDFTLRSSMSEIVSAPVVFAGYGLTEKSVGYDDLKNFDLKGKAVLVLSEAPGKDNPKSPFQDKELKEKYFPAADLARRMRGGFDKTAELAKLGPAAILVVQNSVKDVETLLSQAGPLAVPDDRPIINRQRRRFTLPGSAAVNPWEASRVVSITRETADAILEASGKTIDALRRQIATTGQPASMSVPGTRVTVGSSVETSLVRAMNVVGFVEGADPVLKNEVVIVGAHLDHLGFWEDYIYNGADDNGSGSVGVLSIARAMALNPIKPKRSVVFALWAGEENGLLGSRHYVRDPLFPLEKTIAYFNLDMISRPYDEQTFSRMSRMFAFPGGQDLLKKIKPAKFLPVSFSAGKDLDEILRQADQYVALDLFLREQTDSAGRMMGGSDHAPFAQAAVPWVFAITAMTADYHQPSDSVDKVSSELIESVSRFIYVAAYLAADR